MEAIAFAFALGAGTVYAVKHGRRAMHRAVGWTAEKTGFITAKVSEALDEARRIARERYEVGREHNGIHTELAPPSAKNGVIAEANGLVDHTTSSG
jgi:hypothetical protein